MPDYSNDDLYPLLQLVKKAVDDGDMDKAGKLIDRVDAALVERGDDPNDFWTTLYRAAKQIGYSG